MNSIDTGKDGKDGKTDTTVPTPPQDGRRAATPPAPPAAGAHAAAHLTNEDATPGSGALTSHAHASGKEVDGGAG